MKDWSKQCFPHHIVITLELLRNHTANVLNMIKEIKVVQFASERLIREEVEFGGKPSGLCGEEVEDAMIGVAKLTQRKGSTQ